MSDTRVGTLIGPDAERDAIHIAVAPVVANHPLWPGEKVEILDKDRARSTLGSSGIGIVDPFLQDRVKEGERFWLFLDPGSITSLKHSWSHPAFPADRPMVTQDPSGRRSDSTAKSAAEKWLRGLARMHGVDYDTMIRAAQSAAETGSGHMGDHEGFAEDIADLRDEFWANVSIVTGCKIPDDPEEVYFNCAC
jgi:hypothetical protein